MENLPSIFLGFLDIVMPAFLREGFVILIYIYICNFVEERKSAGHLTTDSIVTESC